MSAEDLTRLAENVVLSPPDRYRFFGVERCIDADAPIGEAALRGQEPLYRAWLEADLYQFAYARPPGPPDTTGHGAATGGGSSTPRVDAMALEARSLPVLAAQPDGSVLVEEDGVRFRLRPGAFAAEVAQARRAAAGDRVRRIHGVDRGQAQKAYDRITRSRRAGPIRPGNDLRFYWNAPPEVSGRLLTLLDEALGTQAIGFVAKRLNEVDQGDRRDSVVLYIARSDASAAEPQLRAVHAAVVGDLRTGVPMFTLPVAEGLGYAEDPASGQSFGQERARILADAIETAHEGIEFPTALARAFGQRGLDADHPHRNRLAHDRATGPEVWRW